MPCGDMLVLACCSFHERRKKVAAYNSKSLLGWLGALHMLTVEDRSGSCSKWTVCADVVSETLMRIGGALWHPNQQEATASHDGQGLGMGTWQGLSLSRRGYLKGAVRLGRKHGHCQSVV